MKRGIPKTIPKQFSETGTPRENEDSVDRIGVHSAYHSNRTPRRPSPVGAALRRHVGRRRGFIIIRLRGVSRHGVACARRHPSGADLAARGDPRDQRSRPRAGGALERVGKGADTPRCRRREDECNEPYRCRRKRRHRHNGLPHRERSRCNRCVSTLVLRAKTRPRSRLRRSFSVGLGRRGGAEDGPGPRWPRPLGVGRVHGRAAPPTDEQHASLSRASEDPSPSRGAATSGSRCARTHARAASQCSAAGAPLVTGGTMNGTTCSFASKVARYAAAACCEPNGPTRTRYHVPRPFTLASRT